MRLINIKSRTSLKIGCGFLIVLCYTMVYSQTTGRLTGLVIDEKTELPLSGVNVMIEKTLLGASTDQQGRFIIDRIPPGSYTLNVSMMGYKTESIADISIPPGGTVDLHIRLKETVISMNPLIVTAAKHPQSLASSHQAVDVVEHAGITLRQSRGLEENLQPITGVHFNEENISIRGSSGYSVYNVGSRVLLMIDGVPVLTSDLATINWRMIPLLDVDRIEVVKGAGSALYGSSAMGGIVNIITRSPSPRGRLRIRAMAGVYDQPHYSTWRWTDETLHYEQWDISYNRRLGPVGIQLGMSNQTSTGYMQNTDSDRWNASGKFVIHLPRQSRLDLYASWVKSRQGFLIQWLNQNSPFQIPPFNEDDELRFTILNFYARYLLPLSSKLNFKFRISHLFSEMGSQFSVGDPSAFKPGQGLGWEMQIDWIPSPIHHITFGSEFRWDVSGSKWFGDHKGYTISPYLQDELYLLSNLSATLGLRLDHHVFIDEETDTRLNPKFGLNYRPFEATAIRMTIGSGFRAATVFEKYIRADYSGLNVISNPDLRSERSWFCDLGIRQSLFEDSRFELSIFQADYWDMIEPVINFLGTIQFQNYIRARIRGVECAFDTWWWKRRIGLQASLTYIDPMDIHRDLTLPYRPRWTGNIRGTLRLGPAFFQTEYRYASRIEEVQVNPLDPRVPIKLLYLRAQIELWHFTLQLAINNALNYHYTQVERRMGEIRNASVALLMDLSR